MKRLFKEFLDKTNFKTWNMRHGEICDAFNKWVSSAKYVGTDHKRFQFKAHTTKPTVLKWLREMDIRFIDAGKLPF